MVGITASLDPSSPPPSALVQLPSINPTPPSDQYLFTDEQSQTRLLLSHYDSSLGAQGKLPPLSRIDPQMVQKKPPPPLRFGLRSMSSSRADSGVNTPTRRESSGQGQTRRRFPQQTESNTPRKSRVVEDVAGTPEPGPSAAAPDKVYHPNQGNDELTANDRKALGAQHLDEQLAPQPPAPSLLDPYHRSSESNDDDDEDDEDDEDGTAGEAVEAVSETARGLLRWVYDNWYDFGWMIGKKGFDIGWSLIKFGVKGGPKKSWGIE